MRVEIAYAEPQQQWLWAREVAEGTTLAALLDDAEIRAKCPDLMADDSPLAVGVWSKTVNEPSSYVLADGDRVEIYRPLTIDPKAARKARAEKAKAAR